MQDTETKSPQETVDRLGLTVESVFVPWSKSRNKNEKHRSLNWKVTLKHNGREIMTTDYSAGMAYCPSYKPSIGNRMTLEEQEAIEFETERGLTYKWDINVRSKIKPNALDVIHSLISDSDVLDCSTYEDWAANCGYDQDSREGERIYRLCLEIALKLRSGLGESVLAELRGAFRDY